MWKPGQLVKINKEMYRIKRISHPFIYMSRGLGICGYCKIRNNNNPPCNNIKDQFDSFWFSINKCINSMPTGCYPEKLNQ